MRSKRSALVAVALAWSALILGIVVVAPISSGASAIPKSATVSGVPAVGTLFTLGKNDTLGSHFCTASVVSSPAGDLVLTAAHCVTGRASGSFVFVPEYHNGRAPYGVWTVSKVIVDSAWTRSQNVGDDFAFLLVHRPGTARTIQSITGAEQIGIDLPPGLPLKVVGYPDSANSPISCQSPMLLLSSSQLQFDCDGYTDGTSGSPLIVDFNSATGTGMVVGVIGGFEQGGYSPSVSYAARFESNMTALYRMAVVI